MFVSENMIMMMMMMMMMAMVSRNTRTRFMSTSTRAAACSWWDHVLPAPKDPITSVSEAFAADPSPYKINLGEGAYRDDNGDPVVFRSVQEAEAKIAGLKYSDFMSKAAGSKLVEESVKLVYGEDSHVIKDGRIAGIQAISGTGACRLFAEFQRHFHPESKIYLPDPTWSNHHNIWRNAGVPLRTFHYYDHDSKNLDFAALVDDVKNAPDKSFFLLHPCAHNPTGVDPTEEQWREISYLFKAKRHFPFFDMAYQGFASGDLDKDAQAIRIFLEDGHLLGCAHTFTKNMGLYGNQAGCLSVICTDSEQALAVKSQLQNIARAMYSRPSIHGVLLISTILSDPVLKALWVEDVKLMANRIQSIRASLRECLEDLGSHLSWEHITDQVGMFCFSGLTPEQVDQLIRKFHIYMTSDGRINIAGVTTKNMSYLANAIHEVTRDQEDSSETLYAANYSS